MKRTDNRNVATNWACNTPVKSHNGQFSTDGQNLFSYNQLVGITLADGTKIALNYMRRGGGCYISSTTSQHVSMASCVADQVMHPETALEARLINRI